MFDTHCHLNFKVFNSIVSEVINHAAHAGVTHIVVPGTDVESSKKAVKIAKKFKHVYAAVGIHPHHAFNIKCQMTNDQPALSSDRFQMEKEEIEKLLKHKKVVAIGEVGLDKHAYTNTKYERYQINPEFLACQKAILKEQILLAVTYKKSLILHNREAADDFLEQLMDNWDGHLAGRTVFHCCEPNEKLLSFAKKHHIFIGVDGDITYSQAKQEFIKTVPIEMLVLETDAPYLLPEPLRSQKKYLWRSQIPLRGTNTPANIPIIVAFLAQLLNKPQTDIQQQTTQNAKELFNIA